MHPDLLSILGSVSVMVAWYLMLMCENKDPYILAAAIAIYYGYPLMDNMDGKQARRLKVSSQAGEFVDHSLDGLSVSITTCVVMESILTTGHPIRTPLLSSVTMVLPQAAFFMSCVQFLKVGHISLSPISPDAARLLPGPVSRILVNWTVDECNFITIPLLMFFRMITAANLPTHLNAMIGPFPDLAFLSKYLDVNWHYYAFPAEELTFFVSWTAFFTVTYDLFYVLQLSFLLFTNSNDGFNLFFVLNNLTG